MPRGPKDEKRPAHANQRAVMVARIAQAFSKKFEIHICVFALHTMYHNFVKISGAHRMTPAQAAGVDSRLWKIVIL